jgi:hypothetical protein
MAESQSIILDQTEKTFQKTEIQDFQKEINQGNQNLEKLNSSFYKQKISFTEFLEKIAKLLPQNIFLTEIS